MKRALLIGINYFDSGNELAGCHNDVDKIAELLGDLGYEITIMKDDRNGNKTDLCPTAVNILDQMTSHVSATKPGDTLFVHYSGHGSFSLDTSLDEMDGRDEVICPVDGGVIADDVLNKVLVNGLDDDATLVCVFDCCNSGTVMDLPYRWFAGDYSYREGGVLNLLNPSQKGKNCYMISGCMDEQTSADAYIEETAQGALTWAFHKAMMTAREIAPSWGDLVQQIRWLILTQKQTQIPQLCYCRSNAINEKVCI